jgi:hypothetical protein
MLTPTIDQLKRALELSEQIAALKVDLASFFGGVVDVPALVTSAPMEKAKRQGVRSAEVRARMAAAQQARRAGEKGI